MPMLKWTSPSGQGGRTLEIRVNDGVTYTLVDNVATFVEPSHVATVTSQITALVPGASVSTPAAEQ